MIARPPLFSALRSRLPEVWKTDEELIAEHRERIDAAIDACEREIDAVTRRREEVEARVDEASPGSEREALVEEVAALDGRLCELNKRLDELERMRVEAAYYDRNPPTDADRRLIKIANDRIDEVLSVLDEQPR